MPHEVLAARSQLPIITPKGNDARVWVQAGGFGHTIAMKSRAVDDEVRGDILLRGGHNLLTAPRLYPQCRSTRPDLMTSGAEQLHHLSHHSGIVHDALLRHAQSGSTDGMGLDFLNRGPLEPLQSA